MEMEILVKLPQLPGKVKIPITILVDWALAMDNGGDGQQQRPTLLGMRGALPYNGAQW